MLPRTRTIVSTLGVLICFAAAYRVAAPLHIPLDAPARNVVGGAASPLPGTVERLAVGEGMTFTALMASAGMSPESAEMLYEAARPTYDLARIKQGGSMELVRNTAGTLIGIRYAVDSERRLTVLRDDGAAASASSSPWRASLEAIPYAVRPKTVRGAITSSLYEAALEGGTDERAVIAFADAMQWSVDFAQDPRVGDTFVFTYEERTLEGATSAPGRVLAGRYVNAGEAKEVYWFAPPGSEGGYYDAEGRSARKMFLKSPVSFKYITSGFTTGKRYVAAFDMSTGHRAIDYATPAGTPIRAVGDGTVTFAGWSREGYGYLTSIRHTDTYRTNYAHQSRILVKRGQRVLQGDIIGAVGSTGLSTGPHLHYEMVKNGAKINPLMESFEPGEPLPAAQREAFARAVSAYRAAFR